MFSMQAWLSGSAEMAVSWFRRLKTERDPMKREEIAELRGKDLACRCPLDQPCHADVLLEIANSGVVREKGDEGQ